MMKIYMDLKVRTIYARNRTYLYLEKIYTVLQGIIYLFFSNCFVDILQVAQW